MPRPTAEQTWNTVRHNVGRALGPLAAPRTGWFYVVRRAVALRVATAIRDRPTRAANEALSLEELPGAHPQVRVHPVVAAESRPGLELPEPAASDRRTFDARRPWTASAQTVLEIPHGVVLGPYGQVGIDDRRLLIRAPMTRWDQRESMLRRECARHARAPVSRRSGRTAVLLQHMVGNYGHALVQGVPGIDAIDRTLGLGSIDRFLVPDNIRPFGLEMLARFGIGEDRIERVALVDPVHYECETLVATTFPHIQYPGPANVVEPVRRRFAAELASGAELPRRRWYVTRGPRWSRRVENEEAVRAALERRGFEVLVPEDCSVAEQARLLASAECVVGIHGAAMTNLVFAPPGTPVIDLMPANVCQWIFGRLAQSVGLRYDVVIGTEPGPPPGFIRFLVDADLRIDVDALTGRVDAALRA